MLSFEWTMLTSLLTVGVVSGVAAVRDAVTDEMGDVAQAMVSLDQSYVIEPPLVIRVHTVNGFGGSTGPLFTSGFAGGRLTGSAAADSVFIDASSYDDCARGRMKVIEFPRRGERQRARRESPCQHAPKKQPRRPLSKIVCRSRTFASQPGRSALPRLALFYREMRPFAVNRVCRTIGPAAVVRSKHSKTRPQPAERGVGFRGRCSPA